MMIVFLVFDLSSTSCSDVRAPISIQCAYNLCALMVATMRTDILLLISPALAQAIYWNHPAP